MIREFQISREIHISECDRRGIARPACILRMMEDAVTEHTKAVGSALLYPRKGTARWVVARTLFHLDQPLRLDDRVSVHTAVRMPFSTLFYRDFEFYLAGELVGSATSIWMLVGKESGKPVTLGIAAGINYSRLVGSLKNTKITRFRFPVKTEDGGVYTVQNSDLDINDHMTNSRYADICFDTLSPSLLRRGYISDMQVNYQKECIRGDELALSLGREGEWHYVRGLLGDRLHFDARMKLSPA